MYRNVKTTVFSSSNASGLLTSSNQHYLRHHSSLAVGSTESGCVTTVGSLAFSENSTSSPGSGRLSELLRRLGFFAGAGTSGTSDAVVSPAGEETGAASVLPDVCKPRPEWGVGSGLGGQVSGEDRSELMRRCVVGDREATLSVGLNSMMSLKRQIHVGLKRDGDRASIAKQGNAAGVHLRSQMVCQPVSAPASSASPSVGSLKSCSPLEMCPLDSMSQLVWDSVTPSVEVLQSVSLGQESFDNREHSPLETNLNMNLPVSCSELPPSRPVPSIIVTPAVVDVDLVQNSSSTFVHSTNLKGTEQVSLCVPSACWGGTPTSPRRPCFLDVTSAWNSPSTCRTSCMLTSSLSTVVHSRISSGSASASNAES